MVFSLALMMAARRSYVQADDATPAVATPAPAAAPHEQPSTGDRVTTEFIATQRDGKKLFRREAFATRRSAPIRIDGVVDDAGWRAAKVTTFDWVERPNEGAKSLGPTEFRVLYDDRALYVAMHAVDPEPEKIVGLLHDTQNPQNLVKVRQSDWLFVLVEPQLSRRMVYVFAVNAAGITMDNRRYSSGETDMTYSAVWEGATSRDHTGWYAEFRIPYSQMRVSDGYQGRWGFQLQRAIARAQERSWWSPFTIRSGMNVLGFGSLVIEDTIDSGRPIEILPYVLGGGQLRRIPSDDQLNKTLAPEYGLGADVKMQVSKSLRVTATINPDFGEVEADPSQLNLTDKEIFLVERRPFFTQDADLYELNIGRGDEDFFYSRRIGAAPRFSQEGTALYVDEPQDTTIYGAGKLQGQVGGLNLGLLSALGAEETSRGQLDTGEISSEVIQPMTSYNIGQLNKSFRGGASELKAIGSFVNRFGRGGLIDNLHKRAYAGAVQYLHQFADNKWAVSGIVGGSRVEGDPSSLATTQTASPRYYQRPDATHVELDPARTSLSGLTFGAQLAKIAGLVHAKLGVEGRSPGFEVNDVGYLTNADQINPWLEISYTEQTADDDLVREVDVRASANTFTDFAPQVLRHEAKLATSVTFGNFWSATASAQYSRTMLDTRLLRGGPGVRGEDAVLGSAQLSTDPTKDFQVSSSASIISRSQSDSMRWTASLGLLWNARSNIELSLTPAVIRNIDDTQFVGAPMDSAGTTHYVLGRLDQTTLVTTARLNYTMTPRMSLQLYAQPFISSGRFGRLKESDNVRAARYADRFTTFSNSQITDTMMGRLEIDADVDGVADFSVRRPDFQRSALISNLVFRWEYRPGSTLFLIWSQARQGFKPYGTVTADDVGDVFVNPSVHVIVAKLSYWWSS